ncbi:hypothetical protein FHX73_1447 [Kitasatospora viridis]|uniref:Uncharacterized protein n=1 Tax=Kitasatospora viridis TaxID=281105 RepID=A0A561T622_9ACTN|nr:hypothetical protein FHX73_1447 [Kitasatospora viridis]
MTGWRLRIGRGLAVMVRELERGLAAKEGDS